MKHSKLAFIGICIALSLFAIWYNTAYAPKDGYKNTLMKIESDAFQNGGVLPEKYTCDGEKINPPLAFSDIPAGTKSLALTLEDPDAPAGIFDHWLAWNIPASTAKIEQGEAPIGVFGETTSGTKNYVPPCPPSGSHRYIFHLYALDTELPLSSGSTKKELLNSMKGHVLDSVELLGLYNRTP